MSHTLPVKEESNYAKISEEFPGDIERDTAMRFLHNIRDLLYKDLLELHLIDGSIPKEHCTPENLWQVAKQHLARND